MTTTATRPRIMLNELRPYHDRYTAPDYQTSMKRVLVVADVSGPMGGYDRLTLDGLLARMVVDEALDGTTLQGGGPYVLPVPLRLVWTDPETEMPLWAANHFQPIGGSVKSVMYWHRRMIRGDLGHVPGGRRPKVDGRAGRYKEIRMPLPTENAKRWAADCIGDPAEIARLLERCVALGKRRLARVLQWHVVPIDGEFRFTRPVPAAYLGASPEGSSLRYCGWTPPYWPGVPECQAWCTVQSENEAAA